MNGGEWRDPERADEWAARRARLPHAADAEMLLVEHLLPEQIGAVLDLGCGDGHLIAVVGQGRSAARCVGLDLSPSMVESARERFRGVDGVEFAVHDLMEPLGQELGQFDVVLSALAIHHLSDERKRTLFVEIFGLLKPGGAFFNFDCVASPTPELHSLSQAALGFDERNQDPSDQPASLRSQLDWLREAGFTQVGCHWKWLELPESGCAAFTTCATASAAWRSRSSTSLPSRT